jgi:hypothetical protein
MMNSSGSTVPMSVVAEGSQASQMPREQQLESAIVELHQAMNQLVSRTMTYGAYVYRYGQREFRAVGDLPPLRCLNEVHMDMEI